MSNAYFFPALRLGACVSADAATAFTAFDDFGSCSNFPALDATDLDVCSFPAFFVTISLSLFDRYVLRNTHRNDLERDFIHGFHRSMHRHRPSIPQSPLVINDQPAIDPLNMVVARLIKRLIRQLGGGIKQRLMHFFAHARIVREGQGSGYSHFPVVDFVHVVTVGQDYANKNVRGLTL